MLAIILACGCFSLLRMGCVFPLRVPRRFCIIPRRLAGLWRSVAWRHPVGLRLRGLAAFSMGRARAFHRSVALIFMLHLVMHGGRHSLRRVAARIQRLRSGQRFGVSMVLPGPLTTVLAGLLPMLLLCWQR